MSQRVRLAVFLAGAAGLLFTLLWGIAGLPDFGHYHGPYGEVLNRVAVGERHATNVVTAIVFDYRGLDTMIEESIMFGAALAVALMLRDVRDTDARGVRDRVESEPLRLFGFLAVPATVLLGLWVVAHGPLTPGGGFQGGVVLAAGPLLVFLALEYRAYRHVAPKKLLDVGKGVGAGSYVAFGVLSLALGYAFLENFVGLGKTGTLRSAGTISLLNWAVALEVSAGFALIFAEFLEEIAILRREDA